MSTVMIGPAQLANLQGEFYSVLKKAGFTFRYPTKQVQMVEEDMFKEMAGVTASLAGSEPFNRKVLEALPDLKIIARAGVGYDAVDIAAATEHGVVVTITPGTNQDAVAEHTFMLILALAKNLMGQHPKIQQGAWPRQANVPLRGRTLAIVGMGRIGKAVALRGIAFQMKVIAYEPYPDKEFVQKHGIKLMSLDDVLKEGDFVTLHLPATPESKHVINQRTLGLMKPTSYLINTARGAVIHEGDLFEALSKNRIAGAGLDVFEAEPPGDLPLLKLDNVVLTAHTAGVDQQSRDDMALLAAQCIARLSQGEWPAECIVNPEVRGRFKWK